MRLFKYLHPDRTDVLKSCSIRFSPIKALNDPFELKPHIDSFITPDYIENASGDMVGMVRKELSDEIKNEYMKLPRKKRRVVSLENFIKKIEGNIRASNSQIKSDLTHIFDHATPIIKEKLNKLLENEVGMLCLTESNDNLLMWAHYADSHQGFVIEFNSTDKFFNRRRGENDEFYYVRNILYQKQRPSITLTNIEDLETSFLTKGFDWSYEKEKRMLVPLKDANQIVELQPCFIHLFDFPASAVLSVTFGCRTTDKKKSEIHSILQQTKYSHVKCNQAVIDEKEYRINIASLGC